MGNSDPLMGVEDVAAYYGIPVGTLYNWNWKGTGPRRVKVGRHVRYRRADVEAWLDEHVAPSGST